MFLTRKLLLLLLCLPLLASAQNGPAPVLSKDSLPHVFKGWKFYSGDDKAFATVDYNDSAWTLIPSSEEIKDTAGKKLFKGIGWLRCRFVLDSAAAEAPLAFQVKQRGASEIYLDGKLLTTYGSVNGKNSSEYYNPQSLPLVFSAGRGGHVLAVRYANWPVLGHNPVYTRINPGFRLTLADAYSAVEITSDQTIWFSTIMMTLVGIFTALFLLHFLFFLYNSRDKSNLLFSLFSLCLAGMFLTPVITGFSSDPGLSQIASYCIFFLAVLCCFSLSGFLNLLFARKKLRLKVISIICLATAVVYCCDVQGGFYALGILILTVALEAIVIILGAIIRRRPGARIIGAGLALLILFLVVLLTIILTSGGFVYNRQGAFGDAILILSVVAILSIPVSFSAFLARNFAALSKSLQKQLSQVQELSQKALEQEAEKQRLLESRQDELEKEVAARTAEVVQQHDALKIEKKKTDDLLLNILPEEVAEELKETGASAARLYENVSVLFTDFVDFTQHSEKRSPAALVAEIDTCFKAFDGITSAFGLEKIKTVGDAYIAVSGLPVTEVHHAQAVLGAALAIRDFMVQRRTAHPDAFNIRLGIHSGPVVAGIVGIKKFAYDIWGDTVNTAARMEQASEAARVNISATTYELVKHDFACEYRGELEAKHKGRMGMYFAEAKK